ncbi:hypothetical protein [Aphanothece sacrum]|uniref:Uncharacterized protein n=1 Tax=Aphanothece sacrum FPU1 TaxID=1920663 RepID=A0A401IBV2_APHSA|nr:hypothetical protein [Aphanothece sacrum]GBF78706.1 hypothetical protein AsFPU1_0095 [Aphanothece sacrum FPU1]GBF84995.1 hypothetical protein AsFPU3_2050 [Aphanothece sacrum FPU3]
MNWQIPNNVSFEDALNLSETLLEAMESQQLKDDEIQEMITTLVNSENGARGFFVTYLTSDHSLADNPSSEVINGLKTCPEIVSELLVKNLAMSSAMAITHRRNNDEKTAQGSDRVCQRTTQIIQQLNLELVTEKLKKLKSTIIHGKGIYASFLEKWGYDEEQKKVIQNNLENLI